MRSLVAGKWVDAKSGDVIKVINPATNELIDTVPSLSKEEIDYAVDAAYTAQKEWAKTSVVERSAILTKFAQLV